MKVKWHLKYKNKAIQIISGANKYKSCRKIFKDNRILTVTSLYIFEVICYITRYEGNLKQNLSIHDHKR